MATTSSPAPAPKPTQFIRTGDFRTIYTNFVQSGFTPYDVSLVLGQSEIGADGQLTVTQSARVIMTPAEAQAVIKVLTDLLAAYEKTWGKITEPKFVATTEGV